MKFKSKKFRISRLNKLLISWFFMRNVSLFFYISQTLYFIAVIYIRKRRRASRVCPISAFKHIFPIYTTYVSRLVTFALYITYVYERRGTSYLESIKRHGIPEIACKYGCKALFTKHVYVYICILHETISEECQAPDSRPFGSHTLRSWWIPCHALPFENY